MTLTAIAAVGPHGEIGHAGGLPWPRLPDDMRRFVRRTAGKPIIMGRATWDSLPTRPLPGRLNIILSRSWPGPPPAGCIVITDAVFIAGLDVGAEEAVVIGGRQTYITCWPWLARFYLTFVGTPAACFPADTYFPEWPLGPAWRLVAEEPRPDARPLPLVFRTYESINQ